jgi:hypothetical protein
MVGLSKTSLRVLEWPSAMQMALAWVIRNAVASTLALGQATGSSAAVRMPAVFLLLLGSLAQVSSRALLAGSGIKAALTDLD